MTYPENFTGIAVITDNKSDWNHPKKIQFPPKPFLDHDVDIEIECCGVCGSDVHAAAGNWGNIPKPLIVGHEIIGKVVKLGSKVTDLQIGDRVGVGAQASSCLECKRCIHNHEQYCQQRIWTYASVYPDGYVAKGGYASHIRVLDHFAIPIPESLESEIVAPMLCGGITVFSPLIRNGCGPGKKVGIAGIGGIGHMGILFAKALGAEVYAFSRSDSKRADALKLGADHYISTGEEGWDKPLFGELDLIVNCASSFTGIDLGSFLKTLDVQGKFANIGAPPAGEKFEFNPSLLNGNGAYITSSALGSRKEIIQMLELAAEHNIKPWVETVPISEEGVNKVLTRGAEGDVKYRFTLVDYQEAFSS